MKSRTQGITKGTTDMIKEKTKSRENLPPKYEYLSKLCANCRFLSILIGDQIEGLYLFNTQAPYEIPKYFEYDDTEKESCISFINHLFTYKNIIEHTISMVKKGLDEHNCLFAGEIRPILYVLNGIVRDAIESTEKLISSLQTIDYQQQEKVLKYVNGDSYNRDNKETKLMKLNKITNNDKLTPLQEKLYGPTFFDTQKRFAFRIGYFHKDLLLIAEKIAVETKAMIDSGEVTLKPIQGDAIDRVMKIIFEENPERDWSDSKLEEEFRARGYKTTRQTISARSLYKAYRKEIPKRIKEIRLGRMQIDTEGKAHFSPDKKASDCYDNE